jgi:ATP-binding cassette subfamily F protein 3
VLSISGVSKAYAARMLFADVTLQVNRGDRVGLVGPNGAGKSTLFELILGRETPDTGDITLPRGMTIGYLPQESEPAGNETVLELAAATTSEMAVLRQCLRGVEAGHDAELPETAAARKRFDELDGHRVEAKAKQILRGLSFRESDFARPAREMSGGWVMRAHLARLLTLEPDLLLLDEPTNHLDLDALLWFQDYLKAYPGAILLISHDREFLNQLVGSVVEIRQARLVRYPGNYDAYLQQRAANEEQLIAAWKSQQREIARLQAFADRFRAKNTKAAQAQSKLKQIERMDKIEAPAAAEATIGFVFPQAHRSGLKVVALEQVRFAYDGQATPVYAGLDFHAERGQRTVLVGPNGAGKSTLLKLLAGVVKPQAGARRLGHNVKDGYYSQYRIEMLHPERTVLEEALETPQRVTETFVRTVLGSFLFRGDDVFKQVSVLSGGEKSRLALVKLLLDPPNLLLMDEPTTHLDIASTDALLDALRQFAGTLIFISHDVYFIRELANHAVHVRDGRLRHFPGGYQYYLDKTAAEATAAAAHASRQPAASRMVGESPVAKARAQKRLEAEQRQARSRERREQQQLVHRLETEIHQLETRQAEITREMEDPATYQDSRRVMELNREFVEGCQRLEALNAEWEAAATRLAAMQASD